MSASPSRQFIWGIVSVGFLSWVGIAYAGSRFESSMLSERTTVGKRGELAQASTQGPETSIAIPPSVARTDDEFALPPRSDPVPNDGGLDLVKSVQGELKRLGCDPGDVDGVWGQQSSAALADYARASNRSISSEAPSSEVLRALQEHKGLVCSVKPVGTEKKVVTPQPTPSPSSPELAGRVATCRAKLASNHVRGYGAIVVGVSNCGVSWNYKTREEAVGRASSECTARTTGCRVVTVRGSG